jgi:parvulin-like peptidyl-prolyl isomerase
VSHAQLPTANAPDTVLVSTKDARVTQADFEAELQRIPEKERYEFLLSRTRLGTLVENVLVNKVLAQEAVASGLDKDRKVLAEIQNQTEKVLARHQLSKIRQSVPQTDLTSVARENYLLNREKYKRPTLYGTWAVLLTRNQDAATAKSKAEQVLRRAKAGEPLEALAKEFSDDPTAKENGGMNKLVPIESLEPNVARVVAALKQGEFGAVIDAPAGFIIVKLTQKIPESYFSFEEIKGDLLIDARNALESTTAERYVNSIRNDATLKVNIEAMEKVRSVVPTVGAPAALQGSVPAQK